MKWALINMRSTQETNKTSERSPSGAKGETVKELNYPCVTASAEIVFWFSKLMQDIFYLNDMNVLLNLVLVIIYQIGQIGLMQ